MCNDNWWTCNPFLQFVKFSVHNHRWKRFECQTLKPLSKSPAKYWFCPWPETGFHLSWVGPFDANQCISARWTWAGAFWIPTKLDTLLIQWSAHCTAANRPKEKDRTLFCASVQISCIYSWFVFYFEPTEVAGVVKPVEQPGATESLRSRRIELAGPSTNQNTIGSWWIIIRLNFAYMSLWCFKKAILRTTVQINFMRRTGVNLFQRFDVDTYTAKTRACYLDRT